MSVHANYIAGDWRQAAGGASFEDRNPADDDDLIGIFPDSDERDVDAAVRKIRAAR